MKLLSYNLRNTDNRCVHYVEPKDASKKIQTLFESGYDRVISSWKGQLFMFEPIPKVSNTYNKTQLDYHPFSQEVL